MTRHAGTRSLHAVFAAPLWVLLAVAAPLAAPGQATQPAPLSNAAHQQFVFAYRLLERGDDKVAAEAFDDYLGRFPGDEKRGDGLYYRAFLARRLGDNQAAARLLDPAMPRTQIVPEHAVQILRGQVLSDLGRFDQALAALEKVSAEPLEPALKASVFYLRGLAYRGARNLPAAAAQLSAAAQVDSPVRVRAWIELARVQADVNKLDEAIDAAGKAVAASDRDTAPEACRLAGDLYYRLGDYAKAAASYRQVIAGYQTSPHFGPSVLGVLWAHLAAKQYDDVLKTFEQLKDALPMADRVAAWYLAGLAEQEQGRHERAVGYFSAIVSGTAIPAGDAGWYDKALLRLATSQFELGRFEEMVRTIERLRREYANSPRVIDSELLLAAAEAKRGNLPAGLNRLAALIAKGASDAAYAPAVLQRAKLYEAANQLEPAAADYQRYLDVMAQAAAAPATAPGGVDPARLARALSVAQAALRLIDVRHRLGQFDQAEALAARLLAQPNLPPAVEQEAMYRRTLALAQLGRIEPALATLDQLLVKHPRTTYLAEARYFRGLLLMTLRRPDEALGDLQAAGASAGLSEALRINAYRLVSLRYREKGDGANAAAALTEIEKLAGLPRLAHEDLLWLGEYLVDAGQPNQAKRYLLPVVDGGDKVPAPTRALALFHAGRAFQALNQLKEAIPCYQQAVAMGSGRSAQDLLVRLHLARAYAQAGQDDDALAEYTGLVAVEQSRIAAAALQESAQLHRKKAQQRQLAGDAAGSAASLRDAVKRLQRAVLLYSFKELSPLPEQCRVELAEVFDELNDPASAVKELKDLEEKYGESHYGLYAKAVRALRENQRANADYFLTRLRDQPLDPVLAKWVQAKLTALRVTP